MQGVPEEDVLKESIRKICPRIIVDICYSRVLLIRSQVVDFTERRLIRTLL